MKLLLILLLFCGQVSAGEWHAQIHGLSWHAQETYAVRNTETGEFLSNERYNWLNLGLGLRYEFDDVWAVQAGAYRHSYYSDDPNRVDGMHAVYVCGDWLPVRALGARMGGSGCLVRGYDEHRIDPIATGTARWGSDYSITVRAGPAKDGLVIAADFGIRF